MTYYAIATATGLKLVSTLDNSTPPGIIEWEGETMADCPPHVMNQLVEATRPEPDWASVRSQLLGDLEWDRWTSQIEDQVAFVRVETAAAVDSQLWDYLIRNWARMIQGTPEGSLPSVETWERWNTVLEDGHLPLRIEPTTGELYVYGLE